MMIAAIMPAAIATPSHENLTDGNAQSHGRSNGGATSPEHRQARSEQGRQSKEVHAECSASKAPVAVVDRMKRYNLENVNPSRLRGVTGAAYSREPAGRGTSGNSGSITEDGFSDDAAIILDAAHHTLPSLAPIHKKFHIFRLAIPQNGKPISHIKYVK